MKYKSTRGNVRNLSFENSVLMGLADDGGLLLPEEIPWVEKNLREWSTYSFQDLSLAILTRFIGDEIPIDNLKDLIYRSHTSFDHTEITPIVPVGKIFILELFHGPTYAFKDIALQFLGNLFDYFLQKNQCHVTVLVATSGDTGSAAIYGLRGKKNIHLFILHPKGRISPIQEYQMTTVLDSNIHNLAVEGTFDDAQTIVKALFTDLQFKKKYQLGAVNSFNWARILAQIVYYFYGYFRVQPRCDAPVEFSVPTGNFGDVLAGYYAKMMGLPINRLIVATNKNDILHRFFTNGEYHQHSVFPTWSPSMDIQISSNFERYLYYLSGQQPDRLLQWMQTFHQTGKLDIKGELLQKAQQEMSSVSVSEEETLTTIREYFRNHQYILDPHTAVGVRASHVRAGENPQICLATAHPAKFADAVQAAIGTEPSFPSALSSLQNQETRCFTLPASIEAVKEKIVQTMH